MALLNKVKGKIMIVPPLQSRNNMHCPFEFPYHASDFSKEYVKLEDVVEMPLSAQSQFPISELPNDLLIKIFKMFDLKIQINTLRLVNKEWQAISQDKQLYEIKFPSKDFLNELKEFPKLGRHAWHVPDNLILLTNHLDHEHQSVLLENIDWVKENFSVILAEGTACNLSNEEVLKDIEKTLLYLDFNYLWSTNWLKNNFISNSDVNFMKQLYKSGQNKKEFIDRRTKILNVLADKKTDISDVETAFLLLRNLNYFKFYQFIKKAISKGIEVKGCEPLNYKGIPKESSMKMRNNCMFDGITECNKMGKRVLFGTGIEHGIELFNKLEKSKKKAKTVFIEFIVDKIFDEIKNDLFNNWKKSLKSDRFELPYIRLTKLKIQGSFKDNKSLVKQGAKNLVEATKISMNQNNNVTEQYNYGCALCKENEFLCALPHLYIALDLYKDKSQNLKTAVCYSTIASCYRGLNQIHKAIECCKEALKICKEKEIKNDKEINLIKEKLISLQISAVALSSSTLSVAANSFSDESRS